MEQIYRTTSSLPTYTLRSREENVTGPWPHAHNDLGAIAEAATLIFMLIASFFANLLAMTQILTSPKLRRVHHNILIVNLNVIDMGITLFSMTFSVAAIFDNGDLLTRNAAICTLNGFCAITCSVGNFTNVMCIAIDRYISIVWSTRFPPTRRRVTFMIAFVWVASVSLTLPPTFQILSAFEYTPHTHHCSPKWDVCSYYAMWFTVIFGITVPVMIFCYVCVIYYIRKTERQLRAFGDISKHNATTRNSFNLNGESEVTRKTNSLEFTDEGNVTPTTKSRSLLRTSVSHIYMAEIDVTVENGDAMDAFENGALQDEELVVSKVRFEVTSIETTVAFSGSQPFSISARIDSGIDNCNNNESTDSVKIEASNYSPDVTAGRRECARNNLSDSPVIGAKTALKKITARQRKLSTDKQVACTGALLVLTTIFCWAPYCIIHFCYFPIEVGHGVAAASMWIAYLNALLDPLIYVFMNRTESTRQHLAKIAASLGAVPGQVLRCVTRRPAGSDLS